MAKAHTLKVVLDTDEFKRKFYQVLQEIEPDLCALEARLDDVAARIRSAEEASGTHS